MIRKKILPAALACHQVNKCVRGATDGGHEPVLFASDSAGECGSLYQPGTSNTVVIGTLAVASW